MNRALSEIGSVPVTTSIIESLYPELKSPDKKVVQIKSARTENAVKMVEKGVKLQTFHLQFFRGCKKYLDSLHFKKDFSLITNVYSANKQILRQNDYHNKQTFLSKSVLLGNPEA